MNPAAAFDRHARLVLHAADQPHSASAVARLLHVSPGQWYGWTSGQKSPGASTMTQWLVRWREAGYPPVEIVLTAEGARVLPSSNAVAESTCE